MATRPRIHARDSSGRQVSLLNDDLPPQSTYLPHQMASPVAYESSYLGRADFNPSSHSISPSPSTPGLFRSDSYDSQTTNDPLSPNTPTSLEFGRRQSNDRPRSYKDSAAQYENRDRVSALDDDNSSNPHHSLTSSQPLCADSRSSSYQEPHMYDGDTYMNGSLPEKGDKRYPCRFRDSHGCAKIFTTSGHASRHSKIHTAEKAVHCSYASCQKKFTRADNMKQHLETHYKDRSRSTVPQKSSASKSGLTVSSGVQKTHPGPRSSRSPTRNGIRKSERPTLVDPGLYAQYPVDGSKFTSTPPHSLPPRQECSRDALDMGGGGYHQHAIISDRPMAGRTDTSSRGLDVLAMAVACQARN